MTGLVKAKEYDWKDSNMALFGSDVEKKVKLDSALTEPAWKPALACKQPTKFIWRIEKFQVKEWPKDQFGHFYNGDSYIVLNVYKNKENEDELQYDVHFWIGKNSTQDEYGTAAYKTVELDTALGDKPIEHREVEGYESELFLSYFPKMSILDGGCATGFKHVKPEEYKPRMLHLHGDRKGVTAREVPLSRKMLDTNDVYVLDLGLKIYQWNGTNANKDEKFHARQYVQELRDERNGRPKVEVLDEGEKGNEDDFYAALPEVAIDDAKKQAAKAPAAAHAQDVAAFTRTLFRLSDDSGSLKFEEIAKGASVKRSALGENDVYILDTGKHVFVYVGAKASDAERHNAMPYAHNYLQKTSHPFASVSVVAAKHHSKEFEAAF